MEVNMVESREKPLHPRAFVASGVLTNFRGHQNVEIHIFRYGYPEKELEELASLDLVGKPAPGMPPELVANATKEAAIKCVLEAFTWEESELLVRYLQERYKDQIERLYIMPLELPAPLGVGPLADIPVGEKSGFINFDKAPGYSLPFSIRAYYELPD